MRRAPPPSIQTIAIHSPGEMGHAIGRELHKREFDVVGYLGERSERTNRLAKSAGIRACESLESLVNQADLLLSIMVPTQAARAAQQVATVIQRTGCNLHYVDCNAIAPHVVSAMAKQLTDAGASVTDASIIGLPPSETERPRIYTSGPDATALSVLDGCGVDIVKLGSDVGQASAIKMCYAGLTKGRFALYFAVLLAAQQMNLLPQLLQEFALSQPDDHRKMRRILPKLPCKAHRWVGEMQQIAETLSDLDITKQFHVAASEIYDLISRSTLGSESPEEISSTRTLEETLSALQTTPRPIDRDDTDPPKDSSH